MAGGIAASLLGFLGMMGAGIPSTSAQSSDTTTTTTAPSSTTTGPTTTGPPTTGPTTTTTTVVSTTTTTAPLRPSRVPVTALNAVWNHTPRGSCLMVAEGDHVLYERSPDRPVLPASTLKLLTATAALERLGPDTRLPTAVLASAAPSGGVVSGNLWLVGGGDPVLGTAAWAAHFTHQPALYTPLEQLADGVVAAGIREVRGQVIGDDHRFDGQRRVASWPPQYTAQGEVGPLSALTVDDGFATWSGRGRAFPDPALGAAQVLAGLLQARGVAVGGGAATGAHPVGAAEVASIESPTVGELVASMLRESDNGTAELLLKQLATGGQGSTANGLATVRATLGRLGLPLSGVRLIDGSGLGRGNLVTCRLLVALLHRGDPSIETGLAVAGRSGTLAKRFLGTPAAGRLRAKTGSIKGVAALAGHVDTAGGRHLTFAYVINNLPSTRLVKPLQEALAGQLVAYGT